VHVFTARAPSRVCPQPSPKPQYTPHSFSRARAPFFQQSDEYFMRYKSNRPPAFLMHIFSGFSAIAHSFGNSCKYNKTREPLLCSGTLTEPPLAFSTFHSHSPHSDEGKRASACPRCPRMLNGGLYELQESQVVHPAAVTTSMCNRHTPN
jgi:hypothetical protein